jgi:regulator of protease activity HflC (stomatin/prohibitin superfamily)
MDPNTIALLAGILFILIAIVGGGFVIKEIKIPKVPRWARIISGFLGLIFCFPFVIQVVNQIIPSDNNTDRTIYSYKDSNITIHGFKLLNVLAKSVHKPPQVNDHITVEFTLQNVSKNPIKVLETFIIGRGPDGNNRDFGYTNENKTIQPNEKILTKDSIIVDVPGVWEFGPSYDLGNETYPGEWQRFQVRVVQ